MSGKPRRSYIGERFGRLTILSEPLLAGASHYKVFVRCDCGVEKWTRLHEAKSCGCDRSRPLTHGESYAPEYRSWQDMIQRCHNPRSQKWCDYGGRGIRVCERWRQSYRAFLEDMGHRPSPNHSLDRYPDNNGNYEPGNVRWATRKQQSQNTRVNRFITINDVTYCHAEWARRLGMSDCALRYRLKRAAL